jgi:spore germination protein GerM
LATRGAETPGLDWLAGMDARPLRRIGAVLCALAAVALAVGCGDGEAGGSATTAAATAGPGPEVTVYFSDDSGALVAQRRPGPAGAAPLDAAMGALAQGPSDPDLIPALPAGTTVLSTRVEDDVAVVDFSAELESGYPPGGSAAELAVVAPIVRTATEAAGTARARILVEGRAPAPPGAQLDLSEPLSPAELAPGR